MVKNYSDIVNTAAGVNNTSNELAESFKIIKEKVITHNQELEQLYLEVTYLGVNYDNKFLLTPNIIANLRYKNVIYEYFAKEYEELEDSLKIEGKIDLNEANIKLLIAVGLGNINRLKVYSNYSIELILQAHYGKRKIELYRAISSFLSKNSSNEDIKRENEMLKKENDELKKVIEQLKKEIEELKKEKGEVTGRRR